MAISEGQSSLTKKRRAGHRLIHALLSILFVALLVFSVLALSFFTVKHVEINRDTPYGNETLGHCILYADYNGTLIELGRSGSCVYVIFGQTILALCTLFVLVYLVIKMVRALEVLSCLLIFENSVACILFLHAMFMAILTTSGLKNTCDDLARSNQVGASRCSQYRIPDNQAGITFYQFIVVAAAMSWLEVAALLAIVVFYVACACAYIVRLIRARRRKGQEEGQVLEEEMSTAVAVEDGGRKENHT